MSFTQSTVPANYFVNITPGVIETGPAGLVFTELMLTTNWRVPIGQVLGFGSETSVQEYFGLGTEANEATVYFNGFIGATQLPTNLMFAQYNTIAVGAWLRGGDVAGLSLAQLQTISGGLTLTIDGTVHSQSINLSSATSFTNAGQILNTDFALNGPTLATCTGAFGATGTGTATGTLMAISSVVGTIYPGTSLTATVSGSGVTTGTYLISQSSGTIGNAGTYVMSGTATSSGASLTITSDILTVSTVASGTLAVGDQVTGSGVTSGTYIAALGTNTAGGAGTYTTTQVQQVASEALVIEEPVISYDGISGGFVAISSTTGTVSTMQYATGTAAAPLALTQATGAVISQGATAATPGTFMTNIIAGNPNFATFQTIFDPDGGSGNAQKQLFAAWAASQNNQYAYIVSDTDVTPTESTQALSSLGYILKQANEGPVVCVWQPAPGGLHHAAFVGGYAASINWNAPNGRASLAYRAQGGLTPAVTNEQVLINLQANGYNAYTAAATQGGSWQFMFPGSCLGAFNWFDSWLGQRWLNNQIQIVMMTLLTSINSIPFDPVGAAIIRNTIAGGANPPVTTPISPVAQGLYNGIIDVNVQLDSEQQQVVINLVGQTNGPAAIQTLYTQGWYLFIPVAPAQQRGERIWPGIILLYCDGGSVNVIDISSLAIQ